MKCAGSLEHALLRYSRSRVALCYCALGSAACLLCRALRLLVQDDTSRPPNTSATAAHCCGSSGLAFHITARERGGLSGWVGG